MLFRSWASAAAHVARASAPGVSLAAARPRYVDESAWRVVEHLLARAESRMPLTSSVGRLFDAVSSLLGICHVARFEGEAAMALEAAADPHARARYDLTISDGDRWTADPSELIRAIIHDRTVGVDVGTIAGAFHVAMRDLIVRGCERIRETSGIDSVALSGGVFMNTMLLDMAATALSERQFTVLIPRLVPCNDGGLSLGQAYVALCALEDDPCA